MTNRALLFSTMAMQCTVGLHSSCAQVTRAACATETLHIDLVSRHVFRSLISEVASNLPATREDILLCEFFFVICC